MLQANLTAVTDALKDQVANRATVIKDGRTIDALNSVRRRLDPVRRKEKYDDCDQVLCDV